MYKYEKADSSTINEIEIGTYSTDGISLTGDFVVNASSEVAEGAVSSEEGNVTLLEVGHGTQGSEPLTVFSTGSLKSNIEGYAPWT